MSAEESQIANALAAPRPTGRTTAIVSKAEVSKAEEDLLSSKALTVEDDPFKKILDGKKPNIIQPTYDPVQLSALVHANNTLGQCVDAMVTNIDLTGYDIERVDKKEVAENDAVVKGLREFFDNPYPGLSFLSIRKALREDLESTGCGYLEVMRDAAGDIVFVNHLDAKLTRRVMLDEPVIVTEEVQRMGKKRTVKRLVRERRYVMAVGDTFRYFAQFKASRKLHNKLGKWEGDVTDSAMPKGKLDDKDVASEIIEFRVKRDVLTTYGVPRWVNQFPSVLGSRKAEEYNLEFFNHGGVPPVLILIQGGSLPKDAMSALTAYLAGAAKKKQRGVVAEVFSTSGDMSGAGQVKVSVERFGAERQNDSMFEKYDERCSLRIRSSFRLPPLFVGFAEDYNYATAVASYQIAEAQVFKPERDEFDEIINNTLMKELAPEYYFRSKGLTVHNIDAQLKAMGMVKDFTNKEELVNEVNDLVGLHMKFEEPKPEVDPMLQRTDPGALLKTEDKVEVEVSERGQIKKLSDEVLVNLADDWAAHTTGDTIFAPASVNVMKRVIDSLDPKVRELFNNYVGHRILAKNTHDPEGAAALLSCAADCTHGA